MNKNFKTGKPRKVTYRGKSPLIFAVTIAAILAFASGLGILNASAAPDQDAGNGALAAQGTQRQGDWGTCSWAIASQGLLTVSATNGTSGTLDSLSSGDAWLAYASEIRSVKFNNTVICGTTASLFSGCTNLTTVDLTNLYTQNTTNMSDMFSGCAALRSVTTSVSFKFQGTSTLPTPSASAIPHATGKWYSSIAKASFTPAEIASGRSNMADTYTPQIDLSGAAVTGIDASYTYTGSAITPTPTVTLDGVALTPNIDYTVEYGDNEDVADGGTVTIVAVPTTVYAGSIEKTFTITPATLTTAMVSDIATSYYYTGAAIEPVPTVTFNSDELLEDYDYSVTFGANTLPSTGGTVTITGMDNFTGSPVINFAIAALSLSDAKVSGVNSSYVLTPGVAVTPLPTVTLNGKKLTKDVDYQLTYENNTAVGTGKVTIAAKEGTGYSGSVAREFAIVASAPAADISFATVTGIENSYQYTGSAVAPAPKVDLGGVTLTKDTDYTVAYADNRELGTATVTITGTGAYTGETSLTFEIVRGEITADSVTLEYTTHAYTGEELQPAATIVVNGRTLVNNEDYDLAYEDNIVPGTASVTINGEGNYTGIVVVNYTITPISLADATVTMDTSYDYTGKAIEPKPMVKLDGTELDEGDDYTLSYKDNTDAGTATVVITGINGYAGSSKSPTFTINRASIATATVSGIDASYAYTGGAITPTPTVVLNGKTLARNTDYTVSYANNTDVGTATVAIAGIKNYKDSAPSQTFQIARASIASATVSGIDASYVYTGSAITPTPAVVLNGKTLVRDTDYTVSYANNVNVGLATVTITGTGVYADSIAKTYTISASKVDAGTYALHPGNNTNLSADIVGFSLGSGANAQTFTYFGTNNQRFTFAYDVTTSSYTIWNSDSGKYLTAASANACANVSQADWSGSDLQRWVLVDAGSGYYYIYNKGAAGMCLDVAGFYSGDGGNLQIFPCAQTSNQKWQLEEVGPLMDYWYSIASAMDYGYALDVVGFSHDDCANVQIYQNNRTSNQFWILKYLGDGKYQILNEESMCSLDAAGAVTPCANVQQFTYWATSNQIWKIVDVGNGQMKIVSAADESEAVDVAGAYCGDGGNAQVFPYAGTPNQRWRFSF